MIWAVVKYGSGLYSLEYSKSKSSASGGSPRSSVTQGGATWLTVSSITENHVLKMNGAPDPFSFQHRNKQRKQTRSDKADTREEEATVLYSEMDATKVYRSPHLNRISGGPHHIRVTKSKWPRLSASSSSVSDASRSSSLSTQSCKRHATDAVKGVAHTLHYRLWFCIICARVCDDRRVLFRVELRPAGFCTVPTTVF
jgi:hypothetical protein